MKYTKEQMEHMLEYAKKWYPPGTLFRSSYDNKGKLIVNKLNWYNIGDFYGWVIHNYLDSGTRMGWIFSQGNWAKIIDGPQPPPYIPVGEVINYEIY